MLLNEVVIHAVIVFPFILLMIMPYKMSNAFVKDADNFVRDQFMIQSLINKSSKRMKQTLLFILICLLKVCNQNLSFQVFIGVCGRYLQIEVLIYIIIRRFQTIYTLIPRMEIYISDML